MAVLSVMTKTNQPLTHNEVMERLAESSFDRATIYRNLAALTEAGLLRRMDVGDHRWRYELTARSEPSNAHAHFVCTDCGTVQCLEDLALEMQRISGIQRSAKHPVEVQLRGLCTECG